MVVEKIGKWNYQCIVWKKLGDWNSVGVFEKFYRVGSEMTRRTKGTGLGLYIVAQIVKLHHGLISIVDNTPKGTVFRITLPN